MTKRSFLKISGVLFLVAVLVWGGNDCSVLDLDTYLPQILVADTDTGEVILGN